MAKLLWTQRQSVGPRPRGGHAMAYDIARKQVVLFGGEAGAAGQFRDTWIWDGDNWTQVSDIGPSPRAGHAMAYDQRRARIVLFGGQTGNNRAADTWEWDGSDWTQIANAGPGARANHALAYHSGRQRVTLFGGSDATEVVTADTWEWDGEEWTQQEDIGPSARQSHVLASDAPRNRLVLFGGQGAMGQALGDTWEWDGAEWTQVADFGPDPAMSAAMVGKKNRAEIFGGTGVMAPGQPLPIFHFTWEWNGKRWTLRQDIGPVGRQRHGMAFDSGRSRVVLFGGMAAAPDAAQATLMLLGDTWEHVDEIVGGSPGAGPGPGAGEGGPFEFSVQPANVAFQDPASAVFVVAPTQEPLSIQLSYTASVIMDVPVFLQNVMIPPNVTPFSVALPVQQIFAALTPNGFLTPGDVTIIASSGGVTKTSILRIVA